MWFVTEFGLYQILMQSRKPIANDFRKVAQRWIRDHRLDRRHNIIESFADMDEEFLLEDWREYNHELAREGRPSISFTDFKYGYFEEDGGEE